MSKDLAQEYAEREMLHIFDTGYAQFMMQEIEMIECSKCGVYCLPNFTHYETDKNLCDECYS